MPNLDKDFYLDKQGLRQLVNELETNIVASEYDTSVSYTVGQYCIYENNFYRCTTATTGVWDSTAWVKVIISDEIPNIQSITMAQWEALTPEQKASGDYVITDATTVPLTAENVPYDDTVSGLTADNVQDAIDELSQSSGASSVAQLEDVQLNNLSDNDLLVYDSNLTGGKLWKNAKKIVTCTKAQFDDWSANNTFPYTDCKYIVTDVNNINNPTASEIPYDNTSSGLSATSVQDAIDEVNNKTLSDGLHNITVETGFTFAEYMNYFKIGKLVIVNIGGITHNAATASALVCQGLPVMRSRALGVVANDTTTSKVTLLYGGIGSGYLRISAHEANVRYYGQITYLTD